MSCILVTKGVQGALDIFRGPMVRGNINLYTVIISLALSNGKEKRKSLPCLCSPRSKTHTFGVKPVHDENRYRVKLRGAHKIEQPISFNQSTLNST